MFLKCSLLKWWKTVTEYTLSPTQSIYWVRLDIARKKDVFWWASNQGSFPCYTLPIAISNLRPFSWFVFTVIINQSVPSHAKYAFSPNCMFELNFQLLILLIQHTLEILSKNYSDHWALIWCSFPAVCTGRFFNLKNGGSKSWKFS